MRNELGYADTTQGIKSQVEDFTHSIERIKRIKLRELQA